MPTFLPPLAPLSQLGRVLCCAAGSTMAAVLLLVWSPAAQADDAEALKAESPYFHVEGGDPGTDRLPLKSTDVEVRIAGVMAEVTVVQHYRNEGQRPLEARYVFPGSTQAAVHAMKVRVGDRLLTARIQEKQAARIAYEGAKREGRTTALLEQHRPNVFSMNVAHILPGDDVRVELSYTELVTQTDGRLGFVFPTVVVPRYAGAEASPGTTPVPAVPYHREGTAASSAFNLRVALDAPVDVQDIASTSHPVRVDGAGTRHAKVSLVGSGSAGANRDFILEYRLAGEQLQSGLMLYQGKDENYFLGLLQPPRHVPVQAISPREYVFVVDISGSMQGHPLDTAKALLKNLIGNLRPSDTFNVLLFSGSSTMLAPTSVPATPANVQQALDTIDRTGGGGSTEIVPALKRLAALPKPADVSRSVIVVTDGYVTVEADVFHQIRQNLGRQNVFAFGIGSSVNRHLIEGIARAGRGEAFIVTRPAEAAAQAERLRRMIDAPVLTHVKATLEGVQAFDVVPAQVPDVLAGRPVVVFGKWEGNAAKARFVVEGQAAQGPWRAVVAPDSRLDGAGSALRLLWARERIAELSDQEGLEGGSVHRDAILALGLKHSLLTAYTSFIAIDEVVRQVATPSSTVNVPSPLPEGVTAQALGAEVPSTPEPAAWMALLVVIGVVTATALRSPRGRKA